MTASYPLVSIIMPAYNSAPFIGAAVESVLSQTYRNHELIVVNDGSTDNTREALGPFMGRLRYLEQKHRGSAVARNTGIAVAAGEVIAFMDADDLLPSRAIEQRMQRFSRTPSAGVVCTGWRVIDVHSRTVVEVKPWEDGARLDLLSLLFHKQVLNGTITIRRDCLSRVGGYDETLQHSQDIDLIFRIALAGYKLVWLRRVSCLYRRRSDSASHRGPIQAQMMDRVLDKVFQSPQLHEAILQHEPQVRYYTHLWFAWHLAQLGFRSDMLDRLRQARRLVPEAEPELALQWLKIFSRWSAQFAYPALPSSTCYGAIRQVFPPQHGAPAAGRPDAVEFWWRVWAAYRQGEASTAQRELAAFKPSQRADLLRWSQTLILNSQEQVGIDAIARFWSDARSSGIVRGADRHEISALYLAAFASAFRARRWGHALRTGRAAAAASAHPRGLAASVRSARWALSRRQGPDLRPNPRLS